MGFLPRNQAMSGRIHMKFAWIHYQINQTDVASVSDVQKESSPVHSGARINPAAVLTLVILAVLFFISGLLHLLVRFLMKKPSQQSDRSLDPSSADTLQRQLQQLFHLHDSGLDQVFIDALPLFTYKEIVGAKEPFDCAVCLCEFSENDQLRLLPTCSHAFHISCIDTWLLSNSTCPLCRGTLFSPGLSIENPVFEFDGFRDNDEFDFTRFRENGLASTRKRAEEVVTNKGVFPISLGRFKKLETEGEGVDGETSSSRLDARRCYSMGSYQYIVGDTKLKVSLRHDQASNNPADESVEGKKISIGSKTDSYSVSKIWMWSKKNKLSDNSSASNWEMPWMTRR